MAWLVLGFLLVLVSCAVADSSSKPVTTVLYASWPETSLLLETSEFLSEYDEIVFWQFLHEVNLHNVSTDRDVYEIVTSVARPLVPVSVYQLLLLSLSLRAHSPTIEMYRQMVEEELRLAHEDIDCSPFVNFNGQLYCSIDNLEERAPNERKVSVYDFDHIYPGNHGNESDDKSLVILYAEVGTAEFAVMNEQLSKLARDGEIQYVFRHYVKDVHVSKPVLSGYGVQLSVKSTEYKAMDDSKVKGHDESRVAGQKDGSDEVEGFLFDILKSNHPSLEEKLQEYRAHLVQGTREMPELRPWQIQDLGFQASQRVSSVHPDHALRVLTDLAQNLPMQAKSLSKTLVNKQLRQEILSNQKVMSSLGVDPGDNVLLLNNMVLQMEHMDVFQLLGILMSEVRLLEGLQSLSILPDHHLSLLSVPVHNEARQYALDVRNESVVFINNLEEEKLYSSWPTSLRQFLQPTYPGMLRQIARNVFNIVFMFDPVTSEGGELVEYIKLFLDHVVPARLGVLLVPNPMHEGGVAICRGFDYLVQHKNPREALKWLRKLYSNSSPGELTEVEVKESFEKKFKSFPSEEVFSEKYDSLWKKSVEFFEEKGLESLPQVLVNGVLLDMEEDLESSVVMAMQRQTYEVQQSLFMKRLTDKDDVYNYFMNKSNVVSRLNKYVVANSNIFDLSLPVPSSESNELDSLPTNQLSALIAHDLVYFSSKQGEFITKELSLWIIADLSTSAGRDTVKSTLTYVANTDLVRGALVHTKHTFVAMVIEAVLSSQSHEKAWQFISALLEQPHPPNQFDEILDLVQQVDLNSEQLLEAINSEQIEQTVGRHVTFSGRVLDMSSTGETAILSNGRMIGPFDQFQLADVAMLHQFESASHSAALLEAIGGVAVGGVSPDDDTSDYRSDLVMKLSSLLRSQPKRRRLTELPEMLAQHSGIHLLSGDEGPTLQLVAFLDPLSLSTQKIAPLLEVLHTAVTSDLSIHLNPVAKLSQMPINSFYRYVVQPRLTFDESGSIETIRALFSDLPHSPLLTMHLDTPHSWLVEAVWSPHDLDNIYLADLTQTGLHADFELKHILVEGQCFDATTDSPTPGVEYVLGSSSQPELFDTIVMANLGYFQLKASPGAWTLKLRQGRSSNVYFIQSHMGGDRAVKHNEGEVPVNVNSFKGAGVVVRVAKQPGMESVNLLVDDKQKQESSHDVSHDDEKDSGNLWSTLSNLIHGGEEEREVDGKKLEVADNETINIFSLASGHLYERFLRIMMLSVLKHTHNPVKFWFLKNFLSPTFKSFISVMASKYGFDYELVEYQWPRWLHAQREKQRIIWGYKILFLDVLFPLSVKKIIFVDADQIVRADLKELLEIPLDGAPYAYTPFCDSRPDMAGFRFWESGYWKNHLGNRRYHISALYVIDLQRFRQIGAGDRLRGQYQALSQDPNSLSNLDQDLPNNMIHAVPIKSLPQEWLWCETWCSLESKQTAKTIDLCNNPMTKEPKLKSAVRIVPEWTDYDNEIKELWQEYQSPVQDNSKQKHSHTEL